MTNRFSFRRFWVLTAMVVMVQLALVQAMAASSELHEHLHHHADDPGHECAVTLMLHGGYDHVVPDVVPLEDVPPTPRSEVKVPQASDTVACHLRGGVLAHAPPRGP